MYNHAPKDYICPVCAGLKGDDQNSMIRASDFVYKDKDVSAVINSFFIEGNEGHVIIVPNFHFENIYEIDDEVLNSIHLLSKKVALAIKQEYKADGITILQNNEPASEQHAFHYHLHVFPRYNNDSFHKNLTDKKQTTVEQRKPYSDRLRKNFKI